MYKQSLVSIVEPIKSTTITRMNRGKKWKYGYVECSRFSCESCNKFFNYYISSKGKIWTIPKIIKNES